MTVCRAHYVENVESEALQINVKNSHRSLTTIVMAQNDASQTANIN